MDRFLCRSERWLSLEDFDGEQWLPVLGMEERYEVSSFGRVRRKECFIRKVHKDGRERCDHHAAKMLVPTDNGHGYFSVNLICGKRYVHRIVAQSFIPNPLNAPEVDHINGITWDNRLENLRWVTREENTRNPITISRRAQANAEQEIPIIQLTIFGDYVKEWSSATAASGELGCARATITSVLHKRGGAKCALGYLFVYKFEYDPSKDYAVSFTHCTNSRREGLCDAGYVDFDGEKIVRYFPTAEQVAEYYNVSSSCIRTHYYRIKKFGPSKTRRRHATPYHLRRYRDLTEVQKLFIRNNYTKLLVSRP